MSNDSDKKPHYHGHRQRLREKFINNDDEVLADYELLEILLFASSPRSDVKPLAKDLLKEFGSLRKILAASNEELFAIKGINQAAISAIKITRVLSLRALNEEIEEKTILQSWDSLLDYCRMSMANIKIEQFRIFFLDKKNQLIANELQQEGTIDHTPVYPREVVKRALELGASALILVHNHPSGDPSPSKEDMVITKKIAQIALPLGIEIHDHLIIGGNKHFSFSSNGLM